jgi:hypothetical protein
MTRHDLEQQLAKATGESIQTIRHRGFNVMDLPQAEPRSVDWDELHSQRLAVFPDRGCNRRLHSR